MRHLSLAAALVLFPALALAGAEAGLDKWAADHAEASHDLGAWVKAHHDAARKFFEWDSKHPEKSKEFVHWVVDHPTEAIDTFATEHKAWPVFDEIMEHHRPAADDFMSWARKHHDAAKSLMNHPRGLAWAGKNIYAVD